MRSNRLFLLFGLAFVLYSSIARADLAMDCTLYVAPDGVGLNSNNGLTPTTPKTLTGSTTVTATVPGSVVCLKGGTYNRSAIFYPPKNGTANAWIVYKNYGDSDVNLVWTGGITPGAIIQFYQPTLPLQAKYIEVRGLKFDGGNLMGNGLFCTYSHHLRFIGNTIQNMGGAGIGTKYCDYVISDGNRIYHNGYNQGWTSGISYNSHRWLDTAPGFHSVVVNNLISGSYDGSSNHSDGNGIIMDLSNNSHDFSTANTPPVLIANNVVYENGGRCIMLGTVSNIWVVNNTCYKNALDTSNPNFGEFVTMASKNSYFINNIAYAWNNHITYDQASPNANIVYFKNMYYGGSIDFVYSDPSQFLNADPLFVNPPVIDPTDSWQYATSLPPWQLGNRLVLQATSPAIDKGIDPSTLPEIPAEISAGLQLYLAMDIVGTPRPLGGPFDLGAYQYRPFTLPVSPQTISAVSQ